MLGAYRLPLSFDTARMLAELQKVESEIQWHDHPDYTVANTGDWKAVALLSSESADANNPESLRYRGRGKAQPTAVLKLCPYLQEVLNAFQTEVHRARLMNLRPGTRITEHRDYGAQRYSLERGFIRVHIPLRTHHDVHWKLRGKTIPMLPGEAWYLNVCQPHAVENNSPVMRVHLVLDVKVNDWLIRQFPPQPLSFKLNSFVLKNFEPGFMAARERFVNGKKRVRKLLGDLGLRRLKHSLTGGGH
jgi:hypothetical protein